MIWWIGKFNVVEFPKYDYGPFYSGDTSIIFYTYLKEGSQENSGTRTWGLVHSLPRTNGTVAYKTVDLDVVFDRKIVLFSEAQKYESDTFIGYFKTITNMEGGIESGFKQVSFKSYKPTLLHVRKGKQI